MGLSKEDQEVNMRMLEIMLHALTSPRKRIYDLPQAMSAHSVHLGYSCAASEVSALAIEASLNFQLFI